MPWPSDPDLLVLHGLRLRGFAEEGTLAAALGIPEHDVRERLEVLEKAKLARHREGRVGGWTLTAEGRAEGERLLAAEVDAAGIRETVLAAYHEFLAHNTEMLTVCTRWQMRDVDGKQVVNDHTDAHYDAEVLHDLEDLDTAVEPVCDQLATALERFGSYRRRLALALEAVRAGDGDWFTKPTIDSYHTVWFELHENLLATLGIERGSEVDAREAC